MSNKGRFSSALAIVALASFAFAAFLLVLNFMGVVRGAGAFSNTMMLSSLVLLGASALPRIQLHHR